ncbi:MAG: hypothetical protein F6K32_04740, partial [Desertifilum sp. SIO1I2]|nr:hypothetical protein [Desertifilum sp. SIO1I2]
MNQGDLDMNEMTLNKSAALFQTGIASILLVVATATSLRVGLPALLQVNQPPVQTA